MGAVSGCRVPGRMAPIPSAGMRLCPWLHSRVARGLQLLVQFLTVRMKGMGRGNSKHVWPAFRSAKARAAAGCVLCCVSADLTQLSETSYRLNVSCDYFVSFSNRVPVCFPCRMPPRNCVWCSTSRWAVAAHVVWQRTVNVDLG